jgi:hypothetical protein
VLLILDSKRCEQSHHAWDCPVSSWKGPKWMQEVERSDKDGFCDSIGLGSVGIGVRSSGLRHRLTLISWVTLTFPVC